MNILFDATESAHGFKRRERNRHFRLVIGVRVGLRVVRVQACGHVLIGVRLDGEGLTGAQDFEQEGQLSPDGMLQRGLLFVLQSRWPRRVRADPQFWKLQKKAREREVEKVNAYDV